MIDAETNQDISQNASVHTMYMTLYVGTECLIYIYIPDVSSDAGAFDLRVYNNLDVYMCVVLSE